MIYAPQEKLVLKQFLTTHKRSKDGRLIVQLPQKPDDWVSQELKQWDVSSL